MSTFGEREVVKAICNVLPAGGRVPQVLKLVEGFLTSTHAVALQPDRPVAVIRQPDGTTVGANAEERAWTTPEMLDVEARMIARATTRQGATAGIADQDVIDDAIEGRTLTAEQAQMVHSVCSSGHGVEIVEGVAGSGKTYALAVARQAWERSGHQVIGCSLAARAAKHLEEDAGIPSMTLGQNLPPLA